MCLPIETNQLLADEFGSIGRHRAKPVNERAKGSRMCMADYRLTLIPHTHTTLTFIKTGKDPSHVTRRL